MARINNGHHHHPPHRNLASAAGASVHPEDPRLMYRVQHPKWMPTPNPAQNPPIKIPSSKEEHRAIKEAAQFEEDDNEDIAYLNFPLLCQHRIFFREVPSIEADFFRESGPRCIWAHSMQNFPFYIFPTPRPLLVVSALSLAFFLFAFGAMDLIDHLSFERYALNQLLFSYGKTLGFCNNTFPYEPGMWPSFIRQVEMKVLTNVCFRVAVCVPMSIRIFVAFIIRNSDRDHSLLSRVPLLRHLNELSAFVAIVEVFSLALFSIVTIRFDYPHFYNAMFGTFVLSATFYMFLRTMLTFCADELEPIEQFAGAGRLLCCLLFCWTASQLFQNHQRFIRHTGCHGYVRPSEALTEYVAIVAYAVFALLQLVDMRNIRFICYPRSCSGECEPLRPENFAVGGKFEHCRAFEWAQRHQQGEKGINEGEQRRAEEQFPARLSGIGTHPNPDD